MLKCVFREVIDHSGIEDYSGPEVVYYLHDDVIDVMYMVPMDNKGNNYPFTHLTNKDGSNVTYEEWCYSRGLSQNN